MNTELDQFTNTVTLHQDRVYALALHVLRDSDDAADIAQEAFLRLWRKGQDLSHESVRPWLLRVTHNLCLDHLRRRQRQQRRLGHADHEAIHTLPSNPETTPLPPFPEELNLALATLAPETRSMVVLHYCEGLKLAEIATLLGTSLSAVKVRLHRARKVLRNTLRPSATEENCTQETGT